MTPKTPVVNKSLLLRENYNHTLLKITTFSQLNIVYEKDVDTQKRKLENYTSERHKYQKIRIPERKKPF